MPRQRRGGATPARSAPSRPTAPAAPARPAPHAQQQQPHSTAAHPPTQQQQQHQAPPQAQQGSGSGLFGQMASTAAGVAVGSSIGHAIGGFFGGGSSAPAESQESAPPAQAAPMDSGLYQNSSANTSAAEGACATDVHNFRHCMDENQGNLTICGWYLDQLKACQAAAKPY